MSRRTPLSLAAALTLIALGALLGASPAAAANVVNGSFETGTLEGWNVYASNPTVEWIVVGSEEEELPPPFDGHDAAFSEQRGPGKTGTTILYQDVTLQPAATDILGMTFTYNSERAIAIPQPDSLTAEGENQQVRVDVVKPTAPIESVAPSEILATVFAASVGEDPSLEPKRLSADLSAFAGQTVRLRIAVASTQSSLSAGVDAVSITSTPTLVPGPVPSVTQLPLSDRIQRGRLTLDKHNGTGMLAVTVPTAGTLTAIDATTKIAIASMTSSGEHKPALIKSTTLHPTAAGTIRVPIRPTATGRRALAEKGRLPIRARLTFTPAGGTAATELFRARLLKTLRPRR